MDRFSYEVLSLIVSYIDPPLAPYAVVSRAWQSVVEARTFSLLMLESGRLETFDSALAPYHDGRRKALRKLYFDVGLPVSHERRAGYRRNLDVFRQAVTALFRRLASWERADPPLVLAIRSSRADTDDEDEEMEEEEEGVFAEGARGGRSAAGRRYLALRGTDLEAVPAIPCVSAFFVENPYGFSIHPAAGFRMARCFQDLEELSLSYCDPVKRRHALRREHRQAVADGVKSLRDLPGLKKLRIKCCDNKDPRDHAFKIQDFRDDQGVDALCEAIRCLAQAGRLVELDLEDTLVSPDLFQDRRRPAEAREAAPWPSLERFSIRQGIVAPDGQWYATGDPAEDPTDSPANTYGSPPANFGRVYDSDDSDVDSDERSDDDGDDEDEDVLANGEAPDHHWRTRLDAAVFDPLARAMAAAVLAMPRLQRGLVQLGHDDGWGPLPYVLECAAPGQEMQWEEYMATDPATTRGRRWRVIVHEGAGWEPSKELRDLWDAWVGHDGTAGTAVFEALDDFDHQYLWCKGSSWRHVGGQ